jgi:sugar phosphate isomerase/epimerase
MTVSTEHEGGGMRLGVCLAAFGGSDLETALRQATEFGPLCLDLPTDTTLGLVDARRCFSEPGYRDEVAMALAGPAARGWPVTCVSNSRDVQLLLGPHGPHTDAVMPGSAAEKRAHAVRCAIGAIRLAERLGTGSVRLLVGCPDFARWLSWWGSDVGWADNIAEFFTHAEPVLAAARESDVVVTLEPHPKQIIYDRASTEMLFAVGRQWAQTLALCVDPANMAAIGHDPVQAVRGWQASLAAVHAKDLQMWTGDRIPAGTGWSRYGPGPSVRFRALGLGTLNWPAIVSALIDEGFQRVLYVEHEDVLLPRRQSIRRSLGLLRELLPGEPAEGRTW